MSDKKHQATTKQAPSCGKLVSHLYSVIRRPQEGHQHSENASYQSSILQIKSGNADYVSAYFFYVTNTLIPLHNDGTLSQQWKAYLILRSETRETP